MTRAAKELEAYRARYRAADDAANNAADARVIAAEESRAMRSAAAQQAARADAAEGKFSALESSARLAAAALAEARASATAAATATARAEEKAVAAEQRAASSRAAMDAAAHARDDAEAAAVGAAAEASSLRTRLERTLEELERVKSDAAVAARERDDVAGSPRTPATTRGGSGGGRASPFGVDVAAAASPSRYTNEETAAMTDEIVRRRVREAQLEADAARLRASLDAAEGALRETREKLADAEAAAAAAAAARDDDGDDDDVAALRKALAESRATSENFRAMLESKAAALKETERRAVNAAEAAAKAAALAARGSNSNANDASSDDDDAVAAAVAAAVATKMRDVQSVIETWKTVCATKQREITAATRERDRATRALATTREEAERLAAAFETSEAAVATLEASLADLRAKTQSGAATDDERARLASEWSARVEAAGAKLGRAEEEARVAAAALARALVGDGDGDDGDDDDDASAAEDGDAEEDEATLTKKKTKRRRRSTKKAKAMPLAAAVDAATARLSYLSRRLEVIEAENARALRADERASAAEEKARSISTLVPIRPRSRGEHRSLRTLPGASLRPSPAFNPDTPRRLSTPTDAYQLHPDVALNDGTTLRRSSPRRRARRTSRRDCARRPPR